jgi:hypothetical protein
MRIYSRYKDYYDSALRFFESDHIPSFVRETKEYTIGSGEFNKDFKSLSSQDTTYNLIRGVGFHGAPFRINRHHEKVPVGDRKIRSYETRVLGFCGKIYPMVLISYEGGTTSLYENLTRIEYDLESAFGFMGTTVSKALKGYIMSSSVAELGKSKDLDKLFLAAKAPYFMIRCRHTHSRELILEICPNLKDLAFVKVMDPYIACQELDMFLSNQLAQEKYPLMPVGTDEEIAASKGFDKYSFRKMPTKKRK